jgi:hypothetical protein
MGFTLPDKKTEVSAKCNFFQMLEKRDKTTHYTAVRKEKVGEREAKMPRITKK